MRSSVPNDDLVGTIDTWEAAGGVEARAGAGAGAGAGDSFAP